jgi:hypothetical protein
MIVPSGEKRFQIGNASPRDGTTGPSCITVPLVLVHFGHYIPQDPLSHDTFQNAAGCLRRYLTSLQCKLYLKN